MLRKGNRQAVLGLGWILLLGWIGCATGGPPRPEEVVFYPPPPQRPRIQFLTQFATAADIEGEESPLMKFLVGEEPTARRLRKPTGVAADASHIYVADPGWDTVIVLDLKQRTFDTIRDRGLGKLRVPVAIAIDEQNHKFVADTGRNQVVEFNEKNEFVRSFGNPNEIRPTGVAVDEDHLYIVNRKKHRVEIWDRRTGQFLESFGGPGKEEGEFNVPTSIWMDPRGHLFVTDAMNFRIEEFTKEGEFVQSYGFLGDGPGTFARPKGIATDREGHLYTVDAAFENVQIWDTSNAHVLLAFGGPGVEAGDMYLPSSVTVSYELVPYFQRYVHRDFTLKYVVVVANNYGPNKVAVYGFVEPRDPSKYPEYPLPEEENSDGGGEGGEE